MPDDTRSPMTARARGHSGRYSAEDLLGSPSWTPQQRRELEALAEEEDAQDEEDEVDAMPVNRKMRHRRTHDADALPAWLRDQVAEGNKSMTYTEDDFQDCLEDVRAQL